MIPGGEAHVARHRRELARFFRAQRDHVLPTGVVGFDSGYWNLTLAAIVADLAVPTIRSFAREIADRYGVRVDAEQLRPFLAPYARITAEATNAHTRDALLAAALDLEDPKGAAEYVFEVAIGTRAAQMAVSKVTTEANLGRDYAAGTGGATEKRWVVTSGRPRSSHASMNGETTPMFETFSNGAQWPGDPSLTVDERANCGCMVDFS